MKDMSGEILYKGKNYKVVFNFNVMQVIQEEYGSLDEWGKQSEGGAGKEPNAKAVIFGFWAMLNEGIDIDNEEKGTDTKPLTLKQVGRLITEIGFDTATDKLNEVVIGSTKDEDSKNE